MLQVEVWWSSLVAAEHHLLGMLDATERARVASLERPADQGRSMVAAALLRVAVGGRLGVPPREVVIDRTCAECGEPHGRPRVLGPGSAVPEVSVSHSGLLVVVALSDGAAVGVDVQRVADVADLADWPRVLAESRQRLNSRHGIGHVTLQPELAQDRQDQPFHILHQV